ncbi:MAG TPA: hypothetical protein VH496_21700 [Mycobacterium sp.]
MAHAYPWYDLVNDELLEQGDLLQQFPILVALPIPDETPEGMTLDATMREYDVVILTQSCDLVQGKVENVLVCPHFSVEELAPTVAELNNKNGRQRVRQGAIAGLHVIPPCPIAGHERSARIVNFKQVSTMPFDLVSQYANRRKPRVRLLPPYREHLAQAFARFIMRVGLPVDFPDL